MIYTPRHYQTAANNALWNYLANQEGNPIIVLPTGAGKSLSIAMACEQARAFGARVVVVAHRKELLSQNAEKIQSILPQEKIGIFSAGLGKKEIENDIVCAGIQSVYKHAFKLGRRELILIDECHLTSSNDESMYGQFIGDIRSVNPKARIVGLSATPFRTGEGPICGRNKLFQRICFEAFTGDLIKEGFLSEITNKPAVATVDTSGIKTRGGEFIAGDAERVFDSGDNVSMACREIVEKCHDRHSVLVFSSGVNHAEHIADCLQSLTGERIGLVTGNTMDLERSALLSDFRNQQLRWLVNCEVLTTGFDAPCIDAIAVLRATMSPGLFAQIVGRGLRKHESKTNCLVLDFGQNLVRHRSLDDPNYGRASVGSRGAGKGDNAADANGRGKECPNCGLDVAANSRECPECGFAFPVKHESSADTENKITGKPDPETWIVESCSWKRHTKKDDNEAPPTLRINYECTKDGEGLLKQTISEWVCLEHSGFALRKAQQWWVAHSNSEVPETIEDAISLLNRGACRMPVSLVTEKDGKYYRIKSVGFVDELPDEWDEEREPEEQTTYSGFDDDLPF